jgi:hypothetical protein
MQKVVGSNPISRSGNPCICRGFLVARLGQPPTRELRGNTLRGMRARRRAREVSRPECETAASSRDRRASTSVQTATRGSARAPLSQPRPRTDWRRGIRLAGAHREEQLPRRGRAIGQASEGARRPLSSGRELRQPPRRAGACPSAPPTLAGPRVLRTVAAFLPHAPPPGLPPPGPPPASIDGAARCD